LSLDPTISLCLHQIRNVFQVVKHCIPEAQNKQAEYPNRLCAEDSFKMDDYVLLVWVRKTVFIITAWGKSTGVGNLVGLRRFRCYGDSLSGNQVERSEVGKKSGIYISSCCGDSIKVEMCRKSK
jgi:hypothetical protein